MNLLHMEPFSQPKETYYHFRSKCEIETSLITSDLYNEPELYWLFYSIWHFCKALSDI